MTDNGAHYAEFIAAQLKDEYDRREWLSEAATTMVTRSAGLLTLLIAAAAFVNAKSYAASLPVKIGVLVVITALLCSACCAVLAILDHRFMIVSTKSLRKMVTSRWTDSDERARLATAHCNLTTIESLRPSTKRKARILRISGVCQLVAVVALVASAISIVFGY